MMKSLGATLLETIRCALNDKIYTPVNYKPELDANIILETDYTLHLTYKPLDGNNLGVYTPILGSIFFGGDRETILAIEDDLENLTQSFVGLLDEHIGLHEFESDDEADSYIWNVSNKRVRLQFNRSEDYLPYVIFIENNSTTPLLKQPSSLDAIGDIDAN